MIKNTLKTTMNKNYLVVFFLLVFTTSIFAVPVPATRMIVSEIIKTAAKKSGKVLTPSMRKASEKALLLASKQYGDDVFKIVSRGGLEALEQGSKHGKLFWDLCSHTPQAARSLAMHADDLLPIARRIGPDFMKLEAHVPGLAKQAVTCFGDDAAKLIAKMPANDAAKLIRLASKADSPRTARMLLEGCQKTSGTILKHLDGKKIIALGLSVSMITAAYKVSNGIEEGMTEIASESPEHLTSVISRPLICSVVCGFLVLGWFLSPIRKWLGVHFFNVPSARNVDSIQDGKSTKPLNK